MTTTRPQKFFQIGGLALRRPARRRSGAGRPSVRHRPEEPRVHTVTDANGHRRRLAIEGGRVAWIEEPDGARTRYRYDGGGRLAARIDARDLSTRYAYDPAGRLARVIDPGGATLTLAYDGDGRLRRRTLPGGEVSRFTYDGERLATAAFAAGDAVAVTYDARGRVEEVTEPGCVTSVRYGESGRPSAVTRVIDGVAFELRCDAGGRAVALAGPGGETFDLELPPDVAPAPDHRRHRGLRFDRLGSVTAAGGGSFRYDACDQLVEARRPGHGVIRYAYDGAGNRVRRRAPEGVTRYRYDDRNRLTLVERPDGTRVELRYDAFGNLVRKESPGGSWRYAYDARQRLASVRRDGKLVGRYRYDLHGHRIARQAGGETTLYHHDPAGRVVATTDAGGRLRATFAHGRGHIVMRRPGPGGEVRSLRLELDHLGSTRAITGAAGELVWQGSYSPFGRLRGEPPAFDCPLFGGQPRDAESGLCCFGARYYDPEVGRFLSPDPWTGGPDDPRLTVARQAAVGGTVPSVPLQGNLPAAWLLHPRTANRYAFCLNNPLSYRDPHGLGVWGTIGKTLLAIFWSSVWTLLGAGMTVIDWLFQYPLLGFLYLPEYDLTGVASGRLGSAAAINVGGLFSFPLVLANILFARRGFVDQLGDSDLEYVVPVEAHRTPRQLRTGRTAYFEHLLQHTVQSNYWGPLWPFAYLFGSDTWEQDATRESGITRSAEPTLTVAPGELYAEFGPTHNYKLVVIGGQKPYQAQISDATIGTVGPIQDEPRFSEADLQATKYKPGEYEITARDAGDFEDRRQVEIIRLEVDRFSLSQSTNAASALDRARYLEKISDPGRPTLRLVWPAAPDPRPRAVVAPAIEPARGQVFFEANPAAALGLSRAVLDQAFAAELDALTISAGLRLAFQGHGITLSATAAVTVREPNQEWQIADRKRLIAAESWTYTILRSGAELHLLPPFRRGIGSSPLTVTDLVPLRPIGVFRIAPGLQADLDGAMLSAPLRTAFEAVGIALHAAATVAVLTAGSHWQVISGAQTHTVRQIGANLYIDTRTDLPAPREVTVGAKGWNEIGEAVASPQLRVRGMATVVVVVQAHVVREDDGSDPAFSPAEINAMIDRANELWAQAGIRLRLRPTTQFIDESDFKVITVTCVVGGLTSTEDAVMFQWRPTPPGPFPAGMDHNTQDPNVIHLYFVEDLEPSDCAVAYAGMPSNYMVVTRSRGPTTLAHELGHCLNLPHPASEVSDSDKRLMTTGEHNRGEPFLIANQASPARPGAGADETNSARLRAIGHLGP